MFKPLLVALGVLVTTLSLAQSPPPAAPSVRLRGTIEKIDATTLTIKERGGEVITLVRPADMGVTEVVPITLADIKTGSYVGAAAMPQPDGTQLALEVLVFPESARGSGEGHYPWDLQPQSTMTNATVADLAAAPATVPGGKKLTLRYKDGEKTVIGPAGVPVVTFKPGKEDVQARSCPARASW